MTHRLHPAAHGGTTLRTPPGTTVTTRRSRLQRVVAAALAGTAALIGTLVLGASPAVAGGPTSVLIVNYGQSRASGALTGSTAYENLSRALDAMSEPKGETRSRDDFMSSEIRLTWMIHDVSPWRVDALFLDGKDVWVSTTMSYDGASLFDKPAVWHRPADARLLLATLTSLGVIGDQPSSAATPRADATAAAAPPARQLALATPAGTAQATGWPWWPAVVAVVAVVVALGLGFAAGRAAGRSSSAGRPGLHDEPAPHRA